MFCLFSIEIKNILNFVGISSSGAISCYRCTYKEGDAKFPYGSIPPGIVNNNELCKDPFDMENYQVTQRECGSHYCVVRDLTFIIGGGDRVEI